MHYEITIPNGGYPMTYSCTTASEAYGCMASLAHGHLRDSNLDLDCIMEILIDIKRGVMLGHSTYSYGIRRAEGEV